jgi:membrane-associated phospholipid phosphatase
MQVRRRVAAGSFIALLILSVWWPSPIVSVNRLCCDAALGIDELSFLGRESPRWDVAFWFLAGLVLLGLLQSSEWRAADFLEPWRELKVAKSGGMKGPVVAALTGIVAVAATWRFLDAPITAFAERIQSDQVEDIIRVTNRFGGGANPALVVLFFLVAGVVYRHRQWITTGVAMALAGAAAGIAVQIVKYAAGRTRPELWLGPFQHARIAATSFPSGHTVGAFALAGVLVFASPSKTMRVIAFLLATAVGVGRVLAFRHWTSDVLASAIIGLILAWMAVRAVRSAEPVTAPAPQS